MSQRITKVKKKTASGFTEAIPIGAMAQNVTLANGTVLQDVIEELQTGRAGHADLTQAQYNALSATEKNDGTVYFVRDSAIGGTNAASAVSFNKNNLGKLSSTNVQNAIDELTNVKINYTDIINNLTSDNTNVPLSAAQGKNLKNQIDDLKVKALSSGDLNDLRGMEKSGLYSITTGVTNSPTTWAGLVVTSNDTSTFQMVYKGDAVYTRAYTGDPLAWTEWTYTKPSTIFYNKGDYTGDLNSLNIEPGFWRCLAADTITNQPENLQYFSFIQFPSYKGQLIFTSSFLYTRQYTGSPAAWQPWRKYAVLDSTSPIIKMKYITATIPANDNHIASVSATIDSGYQFIGWCYCASVSWVGHVYPAANTSTTTFWTSNGTSTSARNFNAFYLLRKT